MQAAASPVGRHPEDEDGSVYDAYDVETDPGTDNERQEVTAEPAGAWTMLLQSY